MRRILLEWGLIVLVGVALALSTFWGFSRFVEKSSYHLRFPTSGRVQDDLQLLVGNGDLTLCDQFDVDASGKVGPLIVDRRSLAARDILRGDRAWQFTIPGLDFRYYRMGDDGYVVWSLRLPLLVPAVMLLLVAFGFRRRLKRLRTPEEQGPPAG